jgi:hypothetical protein
MDKFRVLRDIDIQNIPGIIEGLGIRCDIGKVVAIPGRTSANQKHCARGRSQGFLPCPEMQCACSLAPP